MPEGDTLFRTAQRLSKVLDGKPLMAVQSSRQEVPCAEMVGKSVRQTESRGKHLLIHLEHGAAVHVHLGMTGSWHIYTHHQTWQKPRSYARLVLDTGNYLCVCFTPKLLEYLSPAALRRHPHLQQLGPDLYDELWDANESVRRCLADPNRPIV